MKPHPTRRALLRAMTGAGLALGSQAATRSTPRLVAPAAWQKRGELFRHAGDPVGAWVQNFTSTAVPLGEDRWRLWTSLSGPKGVAKSIGFHEGRIGGTWHHTPAICTAGAPDRSAALAIGGLPDGWQPVQGVTLRLRDGRSRLYFWAHGPGIVRYLAADSTDGRRFAVVNALAPCLYHPGDRAGGGEAAVAAGLARWAKKQAATVPGEPSAPPALISNDATNVYQLPDGSFELYTVALVSVARDDPRYAANDNIPGLIRVIDRFTSADGLNWGNRQRVIFPDAQDPVDLQFYYLSVTHTERGRVGLLGHYRLGAQTLDIEPCFSSDGLTWQRPLRQAWIPRDAPGTTAASYLLHAPHALVRHDGLWHLFYTGGNFAHNHRHTHGDAETRAVLLATCSDLWV